MKVHFLNVGHGDCTIVSHESGRLTMIDINTSHELDEGTRVDIQKSLAPTTNSLVSSFLVESELKKARDELTDPITFLAENYPGCCLSRLIITHPDIDHMRGLRRLLQNVRVENVWFTFENKKISSFRSDAEREDWETYQRVKTGSVYGVQPHLIYRGQSPSTPLEVLQANYDGLEILGAGRDTLQGCLDKQRFNDSSIVLRVALGSGNSLLLPGDVESIGWTDLKRTYGDRLQSYAYKASHHGRDSGYDLEALNLIKPTVTVVSVGRKPGTDASNKLRYHSRVRSTRFHGNITYQNPPQGPFYWTVQRNAD